MELWYAPNSIALAALIALQEAGAAFTPRRLDLTRAEQRAAPYRQINPKMRVPSLVTPQGVLTETPAILAWIAQTYPAARLAPTEPFAFARLQEFNAFLCSTVHPAHAHRLRGARWSDDPAVQEALKLKVPQNMAEYFALIETQLPATGWVFGDYSVADPYLFTITGWLAADSVDINRFPKVAAHFESMKKRPAVNRALAIVQG